MLHFALIGQQFEAIDKKGSVVAVNNNTVTTGTTAPADPVENDVWFDTSDNNNTKPKIWNGTVWIGLDYTGTPGSVFHTGSDGYPAQDNSNFFWDTATSRLGLGTNTPDAKLDVEGGTVRFSDYGAGTITGPATNILAVDADGNLIEIDPSSLDSATNIYNIDGMLTANRAITQGSFDLNFDANTLVIDGSADHIGIGTASPTFKLDLQANTTGNDGLRISNIGTGNSQIRWDGGTSDHIAMTLIKSWTNAGRLGFALWDGTQNVLNMRNGQIGIATEDPTANLDVNGNTRIRTLPTGTSADEIVTTDANGNLRKVTAASIGDGDAWGVTGEDQTSDIVHSGNVGIGLGVSTPTNTLQLPIGGRIGLNNGNVATDGESGVFWSAGTNYGIHKTAGTWIGPDFQQLKLNWITGIVLNPGTLYGKSYVDIQGKGLRVTSGDVGIGTISPSKKLEVRGSNASMAIMTNLESEDATLLLGTPFDSNSPAKAAIIAEGQTSFGRSKLHFALDDQSTNTIASEVSIADAKMTIQYDGNVGIGTTSPDAQLDIESTGVPLKIEPSTTTPTGTQAGQIFMGDDGILYAYDGSRSKWLSVDRNNISWARALNATTNEYLRAHNSASINNGYRMIRNATITAVSAQTNAAQSWQLLILKNDGTTSITFLTLTSEEGKHVNNVNIDVNEGDFIQAYCLGTLINHPLASIEFAWRK